MSVANVLSTADSGFELGTTNWIGAANTVTSISTTQAHGGSHSLAMNYTNASGNGNATAVGPMIPVLPGVIISFSSWFWASLAGQQGQFTLVWYAANQTTVVGTSSSLTGTPLTTAAWTQVSLVGQPAPSGAFWVQPQAISTGNTLNNITYFDDDALSWGNYATNMCPNPSFETSLAGWTKGTGTETLSLVSAYDNFTDQQTSQPVGAGTILYGAQAMQVTTPGNVAGEGALGPATAIPATTTGSMSCNIFGQSGTLAVQVVNQSTATVIGTTLVVLEGTGWTNAAVTGMTFAQGSQYYIQIVTFNHAQSLTFMVDGVMYQPEAPAIPYVDGDQFQCNWAGTAELSASFQPYQYGIVAASGFTISGAANIIQLGQDFPVLGTPVLEFFVTFGAPPPQGVALTVSSPAAAMTDFGIWQGGALGTDLDPAMAYSTWNTTNSIEGIVAYNRPYMAFAPPLDYFTSSGGYNWKRAAYLALGWQWLTVGNTTAHLIADVQTEILYINGFNQVVPRPYQQARQLQVIVKPDRLNYVTNPSFQNGLTGWSSISANQTLAVAGITPVIPGANYGNVYYGPGTNSMSITALNASATGVQYTVTFLIPGRTYMCSMWIQPDGTSMGDCLATCSTGSGSLITTQETGYGAGQYNAGPYGGIGLNTTALPGVWQQLYFSFVASSDTHVLQVTPVNIASPNFPYTWYLDAVMVEDGDILNPYFDGNSGVDALWLTGGTAGSCQSFYYNQLEFARHIVIDSLNNNTPLGITYAAPLYATMPTQ